MSIEFAHFSWPLLLLCTVSLVLVLTNFVRITKVLKTIVNKVHFSLLLKNFSFTRLIFKLLLLLVGTTVLFLAFLGPRWGKSDVVATQEGRDLIVLLDVSKSMLAKDLKPTRLDFAKLKILELISQFGAQRVALVLFSGSAFVDVPLTRDLDLLKSFLKNVEVETIASGTTALDKGIIEALKLYKNSGARKSKLVLVVTDGEDFSLNLDEAKRDAKELGVFISTLAIATKDGAPVPKFDLDGNQIGHEIDQDGKIAISKPNERVLGEFCNALGGKFIWTTFGHEDVSELVSYISKFEKEKFDETQIASLKERYDLFLAVAFGCFLFDWIL